MALQAKELAWFNMLNETNILHETRPKWFTSPQGWNLHIYFLPQLMWAVQVMLRSKCCYCRGPAVPAHFVLNRFLRFSRRGRRCLGHLLLTRSSAVDLRTVPVGPRRWIITSPVLYTLKKMSFPECDSMWIKFSCNLLSQVTVSRKWGLAFS